MQRSNPFPRPGTAALLIGIIGMLPLSLGAQAGKDRAVKWRTSDAARALLLPWQHCAELPELLRGWFGVAGQDRSEPPDDIAARPIPAGLEVSYWGDSNGRWGQARFGKFRMERSSCAGFGYTAWGLKEQLHFEVYRIGLGGHVPTPKEEIDALVGHAPTPIETRGHALPSLEEVAALGGVPLAQPDDRALAAGRLYVHCAGEPDNCHYGRKQDEPSGVLAAPLFPAQPEYPGQPIGSPKALWTSDAMARAGVYLPKSQDGTTADAVMAGPLRQPWLLTSMGRFELWEIRFRARNGGGLLAIYDKIRDRHRWIFATEGDWQEGAFHPSGERLQPMCQGHFHIISFDEKLILLDTFFENRHYLFALDPQAGIARPVMAPSRQTNFRRVGDGIEVTPWNWDENGNSTPNGKPTLIPLPLSR